MKRVIDAMDTLRFWVAVFVLSLLFVFAYAYVVSRDAAARNSHVIAKQQEQLVELCNTIRAFDVVTVQDALVTTRTFERWDVPLWATEYLVNRALILEALHYELVESSACRQIE